MVRWCLSLQEQGCCEWSPVPEKEQSVKPSARYALRGAGPLLCEPSATKCAFCLRHSAFTLLARTVPVQSSRLRVYMLCD